MGDPNKAAENAAREIWELKAVQKECYGPDYIPKFITIVLKHFQPVIDDIGNRHDFMMEASKIIADRNVELKRLVDEAVVIVSSMFTGMGETATTITDWLSRAKQERESTEDE